METSRTENLWGSRHQTGNLSDNKNTKKTKRFGSSFGLWFVTNEIFLCSSLSPVWQVHDTVLNQDEQLQLNSQRFLTSSRWTSKTSNKFWSTWPGSQSERDMAFCLLRDSISLANIKWRPSTKPGRGQRQTIFKEASPSYKTSILRKTLTISIWLLAWRFYQSSTEALMNTALQITLLSPFALNILMLLIYFL